MDNKFEVTAKIFKTLGDPNRLKIIEMLSCKEKCACEILNQFNFTQPTLSHHMKVLMECGLVISRKEGTWNYYKLNCDNTKNLLNFLNDIVMKSSKVK
ncbi:MULTISPECIES: metalloregulator ArsR/SmtB family transcription factor [Clostridium]|uniref:Winged helix-turn-helix transcriptional regulator n=1 Tax=Clostridium cibarium TaxID=2762247 RepID=A0ABR8PTN5_9CLOT|nr:MULTISPECIES: metalloregulator ArsR/SmtB family transcription factor [Clostridium]MBD7911548.1 winged helix-turn-helix transcriptional regulator [Clostridium cibarium]